MPDMISKDLGPVSGYAVAVAHGYTGTEAQWIEEVLKGTQNAQTATQKAAEAAQSANTASQKATEASGSAQTATQQASAAADSATAASGSETNAASSATTATQQATAASGSATAAAGSASAAAADKTAVQNLVNTFTNTTVPNAVAQVTAEGTAQVAAVEEKGEEVLDSIPQDYTALSAEVETLSETKADSNGTYDSLTAGSAEQLLSSDGVEDAVPYSFRQTGGGNGVGTRVDEEIVGGTICWNQRITNGNFDGKTGWGRGANATFTTEGNVGKFTATASGGFISTQTEFAENHVTLITAQVKSDAGSVRFFAGSTSVYQVNIDCDGTFKTATIMFKAPTTGPNSFPRVGDYRTERTEVQVKNVQCYDLTQMFGTAVADQIYAMETASAGAGIAYFRSLFPAEFYAYNAGELMSVNAARKETVGFNAWDEEWELGGLSDTKGITWNTDDRIRTKNFIPVIPDTDYFMRASATFGVVCFYDANKNFVEGHTGWSKDYDRHIPAGVRYLKFQMLSSYGTVYKNDICINLSDPTRNGTYEPYAAHTYPLDSSLTLRGVPKLDANNRLYYDGDIYKADGTVTRRYGVVNLGTLTWTLENETTKQFSAGSLNLNNVVLQDVKFLGELFCPPYVNNKSGSYNNMTDGQISATNSQANIILRLVDSRYSTLADFMTAMSGVYMVFELATPTTETAEPYQQIQVVDPLGTEEFVDASVLAGTRDVSVPVGHNSLYMTDLRKKIENIPGDFSTLLAPIESGFTASKAYAVNEFLIVNSQLYKVTASIANGATITPGTNVTATTVGAVLTALLNS